MPKRSSEATARDLSFEGIDEERRALHWMRRRLRHVIGKRAPGQSQEIKAISEWIEARVDAISGGAPGVTPSGEVEELWDRMCFAVSGRWKEGSEEAGEPPIIWGEWLLDSPQEISLGYSAAITRTKIPAGGASAVHFYSAVPPPVEWRLSVVSQGSTRFLIGQAKVAEIDAVSSVPQLPAEMRSEEAGRRVLDLSKGEMEWQRRIDGRRVFSIKNFIDDPANIIANSAIMFAPESSSVRVSPDGHCRVDLRRFLRRSGSEWTDHEGKRDLRPLWLIDGQHRIRGLAQSERGIGLDVPVILFPPDFSLGRSAKIFAEINTLQKSLSPLHTLFMQHRFGIPSPVSKRDFLRPWSESRKETWNSRANNLSYECAAFLAANPGGPMFDRIRILDQNSAKTTIIQASQWVDFSRDWFLSGGIYEPGTRAGLKRVQAEVENYFRAFVATCNHDGWDDGWERWSTTGSNKGLIQWTGPSQALLKVYPTAWSVAGGDPDKGAVTTARFVEALKPLKWIDWQDDRMWEIFGSSGERPRTALRIWMENAILGRKTYPLDVVMSEELPSEAGKGILSPPGPSKIERVSDQTWPAPGKPVSLRATQPLNTLQTSRWTILDSNRLDRTPGRMSPSWRKGFALLNVEHDDWMDQVEYVDVRVDWHNSASPPSGYGDIRLVRPSRSPTRG